jgi:hypothetical protein
VTSVRAFCSLHTAHISRKITFGIRCTPDHTVPSGTVFFIGHAFPGTSCQATIMHPSGKFFGSHAAGVLSISGQAGSRRDTPIVARLRKAYVATARRAVLGLRAVEARRSLRRRPGTKCLERATPKRAVREGTVRFLRVCGNSLADTPTRRYADTASPWLRLPPRCYIPFSFSSLFSFCDLLCKAIV